MKKILINITVCICLSLTFSVVTYGQRSDVGVLSYNVLHGFRGDQSLQRKYAEWVKKMDVDIVLYQELNGFVQKDLQDLALGYGHLHSVLLNQESGHDATHPIGITSRFPISNVEMYLDSMWHGYIYAKVGGVHCFATHLAPFTLQDRYRDLTRILAHARTIPPNERILIAGDFNALSEVDSAMYGSELLASLEKIEGRLEPKSGTPIVKNRIIYRRNLNEGQIDYSVMRLIKDAGFLDSYYVHNATFKNSAPTKGYMKTDSKPKRIDYIWVNPTLAGKMYEADIVQNELTDVLSDHYPMLIRFKMD